MSRPTVYVKQLSTLYLQRRLSHSVKHLSKSKQIAVTHEPIDHRFTPGAPEGNQLWCNSPAERSVLTTVTCFCLQGTTPFVFITGMQQDFIVLH